MSRAYIAAIADIRKRLAVLEARSTKPEPEPGPACGTFTACDGRCCERTTDPAPRCCECGTTNPGGRAFYENHQGQLFCWPCADGDKLCDCHQPPARLSQHVQPPTAEERLKAAEATIGAVREVLERSRGRGPGNEELVLLRVEVGEALVRYSNRSPVGSLKAEWVPNDPSEKCRCSHAFAAHILDACRTCAEDGLGILHKHPFIAR